MSTATQPPQSARDSGDVVKFNLSRIAVVIAVIAGILGLAGAWVVLPYRMDQAEKKQEVFETRTERRFEAADERARQQSEILIRIDENVKQLRRERREAP
ncbi:MAG TPA: hypothetical protein VEB22_03665 [Phycisphaerales bacterium]|nr:hypothetical protein [Phycisphaerales bacterium]